MSTLKAAVDAFFAYKGKPGVWVHEKVLVRDAGLAGLVPSEGMSQYQLVTEIVKAIGRGFVVCGNERISTGKDEGIP